MLPLSGFTRSDVATLFAGLEERTGIELLPGAVDRAHELTQGHPFLVNALAQRIAEGSEGRTGPLTAVDIERAKDLLASANLTVMEICLLVGFSSPGSFSRRFAGLVGCSPTEYRRRVTARGGPPPIPGCVVMAWARPLPRGSNRG